MSPPVPGALREVAVLFLKLGTIGFGGPAAHIALMRDEVVHRRGWSTDQEFLDMVGATNLIPGPNSTEMAIHLGHRRAGWRGLVAAGVAFIVPAVVIVLALAWLYEAAQLSLADRRGGRGRPALNGVLARFLPPVDEFRAKTAWSSARTAVPSWWPG